MKSDRKRVAQKCSYIARWRLFLFLLCGLTPGAVSAVQHLTLAWDPVPSPLVAGYRVHMGTQSRRYNVHVNIEANAFANLLRLADGTLYFFAVTAYDVFGNESDYSQEIYYVTPGTNSISPWVRIVEQPWQQDAALGSNVTFRVKATGGGTLSYQWRKDGANLPGANSAHLEVDVVDSAAAGNYSVEVRNVLGAVVSDQAALRIVFPPNLESATRLSDGSIRLIIGNSDRKPLTASQVYRFRLEAAPHPRSTAAWTPLENGLSFEEGRWIVKDPESRNLPQRYYRCVSQRTSIGPLRLAMPERLSNGRVRLRANPDAAARALTPGEATKVRFEATHNPGLPKSWVPLTQPPELVDGTVVGEDEEPRRFSWAKRLYHERRFYRAVVDGSPPPVRLQAAAPDADGSFRLRVDRSDGKALSSFDVFNYEVWVKTNLLSESSWQLLTNPFTFSNGKLIMHDTAASGSGVRVYRVYAR